MSGTFNHARHRARHRAGTAELYAGGLHQNPAPELYYFHAEGIMVHIMGSAQETLNMGHSPASCSIHLIGPIIKKTR